MTKTKYLIIILIAAAVFLSVFYWLSYYGKRTGTNNGVTDEAISEQYQFTSRDISFESDGHTIYGRALIPQTNKPAVTVVFSHGFGGNHEQELTLQEYLASSGIAVYAFDFAGGSGYSPGQSEGEMTDMSVLTEVQNLEDALAVIRNQEFADSDNIFLLGASQGGVVSSITAAENPKMVKGLFLLYPAFSLFDDAHDRFESAEAIPETYNLMGLTVGSRYFTDIWDYDIYDKIGQYGGDVGIFHGTDDDLVPMSYAERAGDTFPHAVLTQLKGEGHGFSDSAQEKIAADIINAVNNNQ
ncbi:alpha/beta fold hydrolase [Streptococcus chenjunshii]|uniref:Alpha/beta fold hydrolase n=1 Tax=Streptococcus chenjunshii TaxID=2173853 RepID=A0A372KPN7_9STRE|nr:alpha/beta fold hydrolase [Streptococcus chenjunshii]AXQ78476.1 alpha/beta fold hydrolase [Streptococcus chenjunshii]RFU52063.1 alpha/beta fold hydrolase [Streptococcus chenjunshii]RFU54255.1 alpha/beta fold hydrolase [Streptococcus chenjunshii]